MLDLFLANRVPYAACAVAVVPLTPSSLRPTNATRGIRASILKAGGGGGAAKPAADKLETEGAAAAATQKKGSSSASKSGANSSSRSSSSSSSGGKKKKPKMSNKEKFEFRDLEKEIESLGERGRELEDLLSAEAENPAAG